MLFNSWEYALVLSSLGGGLLVYVLAVLSTLVHGKIQQGRNAATLGSAANGTQRTIPVFRRKNVLVGFFIGLVLGPFVYLDLLISVSARLDWTAIFAASLALLVSLILWRSPVRDRMAIPVLVMVTVFGVRAVNWSSRKPFLKDLYRIREGMSVVQVQRIMGEYMTGDGHPIEVAEPVFDEGGQMMEGTISYRHTDEQWGNSDWGGVEFQDGQVVKTWFLLD